MVASASGPQACVDCLVCGCTRVHAVGDVAVADLVSGYRKRFGLDVSDQFGVERHLTEFHCPDCDLCFFSPVITGNEDFYRGLAGLPWYYMEDKREFAIARRFVQPTDAVLEIGAGRGVFAAQCTGSYVGLEFNAEAVALARRAGANVIIESVETHAARHAGHYDVSCAFQVLEHVSDPRGFVASIAAATRSGGRVILSVPSEDGLAGRTLNDFLNLPPHHVTLWSDKALTALARSAGLSIETLEHEAVADYHLGGYFALGLCRALAPQLIAGPGNRVRLGFVDYVVWRTLWLTGRVGALVCRPFVAGKEFAPGRGHTVVAVMRKG